MSQGAACRPVPTKRGARAAFPGLAAGAAPSLRLPLVGAVRVQAVTGAALWQEAAPSSLLSPGVLSSSFPGATGQQLAWRAEGRPPRDLGRLQARRPAHSQALGDESAARGEPRGARRAAGRPDRARGMPQLRLGAERLGTGRGAGVRAPLGGGQLGTPPGREVGAVGSTGGC